MCSAPPIFFLWHFQAVPAKAIAAHALSYCEDWLATSHTLSKYVYIVRDYTFGSLTSSISFGHYLARVNLWQRVCFICNISWNGTLLRGRWRAASAFTGSSCLWTQLLQPPILKDYSASSPTCTCTCTCNIWHCAPYGLWCAASRHQHAFCHVWWARKESLNRFLQVFNAKQASAILKHLLPSRNFCFLALSHLVLLFGAYLFMAALWTVNALLSRGPVHWGQTLLMCLLPCCKENNSSNLYFMWPVFLSGTVRLVLLLSNKLFYHSGGGW